MYSWLTYHYCICFLQYLCGAVWTSLEFLCRASTHRWELTVTARTGRLFTRWWLMGEFKLFSSNPPPPWTHTHQSNLQSDQPCAYRPSVLHRAGSHKCDIFIETDLLGFDGSQSQLPVNRKTKKCQPAQLNPVEPTSPGEECQRASRGGYTEHYCVKGSLEPGSLYQHNSCNIILYSSAHDLSNTPRPALMKCQTIVNPDQRHVRPKLMTLNLTLPH